MSDDWIKYRVGLPTNPRVIKIAGILRKPIPHIVGSLMAFWAIGDKHTTDGVLDGYTPDVVDDMIGLRGFAEALRTVGWLEVGEGSVTIPDFDEHNSQSAKRRASKAKDMERYRCRSVDNARPQNDHRLTTERPPEKEEEKEDTKGIPPVAARRAPKGAAEPPMLIPKPPPITWDHLGGWRGIDERRMVAWGAAYPACDLERQLAAMHAWLTANPERARKSNYERFITNWLKKEQDHGGDMRNSNANGNRNRNRPDSHSEAADRRAAKAAREFPEPDLELPVFVFGGDKRADDSQRPTAPAPRSQAGGA